MKLKDIPNALSVARLTLIPVLWVLALKWPEARLVFVAVLGTAYMTDCIDGYLCRKYGLSTPLGAKLDRWADDLLIVNTATWLWVLEPEIYLRYWPILGGLLGGMGLSIALQYRRFRRKIPFHLLAGKTTNWVIGFYAAYSFVFGPAWWAIAILGVIGGYALIEEIYLICTRDDLDEHVISMFHRQTRHA